MNCNCLTEIRQKLTDHAAKQGVVNPALSENFLAIDFSTGAVAINLPYTVHGDNKPYNTAKGKQLNMVASFCPFCGKPASAKPEAERAK